MSSQVPRRRILLVDDDEADRTILQRTLGEVSSAYDVTMAATGAEGLELARNGSFDCVLLDYYLPDMDGVQFLHALTDGDPYRPQVPIAMLTGREDSRIAAVTLQKGAQDYVIKGTVNGHGLVRLIENAIEKFAIRRELEEKRAALELRTWELEMVRDELQERLVELTHATRAKDQFVAVMSHEMRTPLNAILGYADLMDLGVSGELSETQKQTLERIRVGGRHLLSLINDVLDLSRASAGHVELDIRAVDAVAVAEEVVALLESQAALGGIDLVLTPPDGTVPEVAADLQRLRQVLTNVIGNAIKFTDEGHVHVSIEARADAVAIRVEDTGIGIAAEQLPLVFAEFYQADGALTRRHGGSGLGLSIAQRLVQLMHGRIEAESRLGEGSTFTIVLPYASEEEKLAPRATDDAELRAPEPEVARDGDRPRISVVAFGREEEHLAALARRIQSQVHLAWTTRVDEVVDLARAERPTLIVLDISGDDGAAWRAAHALQEITELMHVAVLLLPGIPEPAPGDDAGGLDLGWVALVPKPFDAQQLTQAVTRAARTTPSAMEGTDGRTVEVLIVDDDPDSRRVASRFLTAAGARVHEATGGETALAMMRRRRPDVLVLDLMMPVLDGFGVLATMRADPMLVSIPVVVLSAKTLSEEERRFLGRAAVRVLQKGEHRFGDVASLVLRAAARTEEG